MQGGVCGQLMLGTILPDPRGGVVVSTCMQGGVCGQLMLGTILPDPRGGVVVSTDLRLRHRVAFIIDELDALRDALIHLLILLLLVT